MRIRKARPVALALLAIVPLGLGTTLPANAGNGGTCAAERACLFENRDFNTGYTEHWPATSPATTTTSGTTTGRTPPASTPTTS